MSIGNIVLMVLYGIVLGAKAIFLGLLAFTIVSMSRVD